MESNNYKTQKSKFKALVINDLKSSWKGMLVTFLTILFCSPGLNVLFVYMFNEAELVSPDISDAMWRGGILVGMMVLSCLVGFNLTYMHNKRKMDFFGSLPVSSRTFLFSKVLSSILFALIPYTVSAIINVFYYFEYGDVVRTIVSMWLVTCIYVIANISMITFICVCCGRTIDAVITYVLYHALSLLFSLMIYEIPSAVFPSISSGNMGEKEIVIYQFVSPFMASFFSATQNLKWLTLLWWAIVAALMFAASFMMVKIRKAEVAQDRFAFSIIGIIIKYIASVLSGVLLGFLAAEACYSKGNVITQMMWYVIWSVIGIIVAHTILHTIFNKGFSGYKKSLPALGISVVTSIVIILIILGGMFGVVEYVPDAGSIEKIEIATNLSERFCIDGKNVFDNTIDKRETDLVNEVVELHSELVDDIKSTKQYGLYPINYYSDEYGYTYNDEESLDWVEITYVFNNGSKLSRSYYTIGNKTISDKLMERMNNTKNAFEVIPMEYLRSFGVTKKNGDYISDFYEDQISYEKDEIRKFFDAYARDEEEVKKPGRNKYVVEVEYNTGQDYYYTDMVVPENYSRTIEVIENTDMINKGYSDFIDSIEEDSHVLDIKNEDLESTERTVYFKVPDGWNRELPVRCMPARKDVDNITVLATNVKNEEITKCEKIADDVYKYTVPEMPGRNDYDGIVFYQYNYNEFRASKYAKFSNESDKDMLTIDSKGKGTWVGRK